MAEQAISTREDSPPEGDPSLAELREELARSREEVLRLRDLLIGKDAELGTLRGRLAELEAGAAPLVSIAARLRRLSPSVALAAAARLRRRGRRG